MIIAIDGPTASGKSTVARMLAQNLGYYYVCSGLLYRALAYLLITHYGYTEHTVINVKPEDIAACFDPQEFSYIYLPLKDSQERIFFNQEDITPHLKDSVIDKITSITSTNLYVRHFVTTLQRSFARDHDIVIDGRDVGTAVFPDAQAKFFLTASIEVRAKRWLCDQKKRGNNFSVQQAIEKISDRDKRDKERDIAPLAISEDAFVVDNSNLNLQETFDLMLAYSKKRL